MVLLPLIKVTLTSSSQLSISLIANISSEVILPIEETLPNLFLIVAAFLTAFTSSGLILSLDTILSNTLSTLWSTIDSISATLAFLE